jgi:arginyl-tRNA synthetase
MDSNVSKNTFFYKFFKLSSNPINLSLKELIKFYLLTAIKSLKLQQDVDIDLNILSNTIAKKIILLQSQSDKLSRKTVSTANLSRLKLSGLIYRSAIAFPLSAYSSLSPEIVAAKLIKLLPSSSSKFIDSIELKFAIRVISPGWIDFYLSSQATALWLEKLVLEADVSSLSSNTGSFARPASQPDLFFLQYVYARCISLLRLAQREGSITLIDENFDHLTWSISSPNKISWLDDNSSLWLTHPAELYLLGQLLMTNDKLASGESENWVDLAYSLSEAMLSFDADCLIFGEVKQQTPEKAIARLGLVALVQYYLQKLLITKLKIEPLTEI